MSIKQAMIFAAGHAKRMRPLTDHLPKPLLEVGGQPILTHIINHLNEEGVTRIVINGYHAITPLKDYIQHARTQNPTCEIILSEETELLETGGGAVQAMEYMDQDAPLYMINGDAFWINPENDRSLRQLQEKWHQMDNNNALLLMLQPKKTIALTNSVGDYDIIEGKAIRSYEKIGSHMFAGVRICHPSIIQNYKAECFSFLQIMDDKEASGNLYGYSHQGLWYDLSRPDDLAAVDKAVKAGVL